VLLALHPDLRWAHDSPEVRINRKGYLEPINPVYSLGNPEEVGQEQELVTPGKQYSDSD
jgi:hypothetical protein